MTNQTPVADEPRRIHDINLPKVIGIIIMKTPSLMVRCGGELLRFRIQARKAGRIFQEELEHQGMDPEMALRLTACYRDGSDLGRLIGMLR